jgi:hypothetical protein
MSEFLAHWDDAATVQHSPRFNPPTWAKVARFWPPFLRGTDGENLTGRTGATADLQVNHAYGLYIPLTYSVWGALAAIAQTRAPSGAVELNPWVFHSANILLHSLSAAVVFAILRQLVRTDCPAFAGALLFAIHPLQVESVGWISGMKDVLCGLLTLVAIWQFIAARQKQRSFWRTRTAWLALLAFAGALLSKPSAVTIPLIVLAIDLLALRRSIRGALTALWPWFALSILFGWIAAIAQPAIGVTPAPLWARPLIVGDSITFYLAKLLLPIRLGLDYGRTPAEAMRHSWFYFGWLVPAALLAVAWVVRRTSPLPMLGVLIFILAPATTLGLRTFLFQYYSTVADHYVYVAMLGPAIAFGWLLSRYRSRALAVAAAIVLVSLALRTFIQTGIWHDDITLFTHAAEVNPNSFLAHNNLGDLYLNAGALDSAEADLFAANLANPNYLPALENLARLSVLQGRNDQAIEWIKRAIVVKENLPPELRTGLADDHLQLARLLEVQGRTTEAAEHFEIAKRLKPPPS